jgi:Arc/MetJ family transcription regulator
MICIGGQAMRTTLNLDDEALTGAMKVASGMTKTDVINEALREFAKRRRLLEFLEFRGKTPWEGDLEELRKRRKV